MRVNSPSGTSSPSTMIWALSGGQDAARVAQQGGAGHEAAREQGRPGDALALLALRHHPVNRLDRPVDHPDAQEHPVVQLAEGAVLDPQHLSRDDVLLDLALAGPLDQRGHGLQRVALTAEVERGHVGAAPAQRRHDRHPLPELAVAEDLGQRMLERSVAAVHDEQVDLALRQLAQRLGHGARAVGLDVLDLRMGSQEREQAVHLGAASSRSQVVQ